MLYEVITVILGIAITIAIYFGRMIVGKILDLANSKKITLIVIGSHGLQGISKLKTLGSVSRRISESAKCPVLIVR